MTDPEAESGEDIAVLKRSKITALSAVTRCRNSLAQLMLKDDNLHHVKTQLDEYDELFLLYQEAHEIFYDALSLEEDQDKETKRYCEHENNIRDFRRQTIEWINDAERRLSDSMEQLSLSHSRRSGSSRSSHKSRASSTQSARAREKANLAALLVEREFQSKKQAILAEEQKLKLDLEIGKARAREKVYAAEIHQESYQDGVIRDLTDALIKALHDAQQEDSKTHDLITEDHLVMTMFDAFAAGFETTATAILWFMTFMVNYPDIQSRIQSELDSVVGRDTLPRWEDRSRLPYLVATIEETFRRATVAPLLIPLTTRSG